MLLVAERAARAAAEETQRHLQQLIDMFPEAVVITDAHGRLSMTNAVGRALLGEVPPGTDMVHSAPGQMLAPDGQACPSSTQPHARALASGDRVQGEQFLIRSADGEEVPVLVSAAALVEVDGRVSTGVMAIQDIGVLKALDRQKDDFLAAVAHDLKHPLTIIAGNAQLLERRARRSDQRDVEMSTELLRSTIRTTRRAASIVNELLDLTRTQMQRPLLLERASIDLATITQEVVTELARTTERHEIRLTAAPTIGPWDRNRLYRVIFNLVENAVKFSPQGGLVDVCVRPQRDTQGKERAELIVKDRGFGIPREELPLIFGKFYRASNVNGVIDGSGIGLTAALQVAEAHGGTILVDSAVGAGTTISMILPMRQDEE